MSDTQQRLVQLLSCADITSGEGPFVSRGQGGNVIIELPTLELARELGDVLTKLWEENTPEKGREGYKVTYHHEDYAPYKGETQDIEC